MQSMSMETLFIEIYLVNIGKLISDILLIVLMDSHIFLIQWLVAKKVMRPINTQFNHQTFKNTDFLTLSGRLSLCQVLDNRLFKGGLYPHL